MRERNDRQDADRDGPAGPSADVRRAQAVLSALHVKRRECLSAREEGTLDETDLLDWQALLLDCVEALRPWRDRTGDRWDRAGPDWIDGFDDVHNHTGAVERERIKTVGFGRQKKVTERVPRLLGFETLLSLSRDLEDIAEQQGLNAGPETNPEQVDGGVL